MSPLIYLDTGEIFETDAASMEPIGEPVATLQHAILDDDAHSLGLMFAAAPELFEALRRCAQVLEGDWGHVEVVNFARDALAKATQP